jgi:hypothetical protein
MSATAIIGTILKSKLAKEAAIWGAETWALWRLKLAMRRERLKKAAVMRGLLKMAVAGLVVGSAGCARFDAAYIKLAEKYKPEWIEKINGQTNAPPVVTNAPPTVPDVPVVTNTPPVKPPPMRVDWTKVYRERAIGYYDGTAGTWHMRGILPYQKTVICEMHGNKVVQYLTNSKGQPYDGKSSAWENPDFVAFAPVNADDYSEDLGLKVYGKATRNGATFAVFAGDGELMTSKRIDRR